MMLDPNINTNYSKENYLSFREGYRKLPLDLINIVNEYLIFTPANSQELCELYRDSIMFEDLNDKPIYKWSIRDINWGFNVAFEGDNFEISSLLLSLNRINLHEFKDKQINWLYKSIIGGKYNFLNAILESLKLNVEQQNQTGNPISKWPTQKIKDCFYAAFEGDNNQVASLLIALNRINLNENFELSEHNKINWLHKSVISKKNNFFDALFKNNQLDVNKQTHIDSIFSLYAKNQTPLHLAILNKNRHALEQLLKNTKISILVKNERLYLPYDYAIKYNFGIELFHKQFGEAFLFTNCADAGTLRIACENNATNIAIPLIYRFDVNAPYADYQTLLFSCVAKSSDPLILQTLLTHPQIKPNIFCPFVYTKCTPLHLALKINNMPAFRLLIAHPDINVDANDIVEEDIQNVLYAMSPLNTAIKEKNVEAVDLILKKKPKLTYGHRSWKSLRTVNSYHRGELMGEKQIESLSTYHYSPLELAKETKNKEIIAMVNAYSRSLENKERKN